MNWTTFYISGNTDFRSEVRRKLRHSDLPNMPGFIECPPTEAPCDLYWVDSTADLRTFKETIGGKLIWKHRLRFYASLEAFQAAREVKERPYTSREREMMKEMRNAS